MLKSACTAVALTFIAGTASATDLAATTFVYDYGVAHESVSPQEHVICDSCAKNKLTLAPQPIPVTVKFSQPEPAVEVESIAKEEAPISTPAKPVAKKLGIIHFRLNDYHLLKKEQKRLKTMATTIKTEQRDGGKVKIAAYTCDLGSKSLNDRLAVRRANAVASFLRQEGVSLIETTASGKCCFVSETTRSLNRRAEITLWSVPNE